MFRWNSHFFNWRLFWPQKTRLLTKIATPYRYFVLQRTPGVEQGRSFFTIRGIAKIAVYQNYLGKLYKWLVRGIIPKWP